jgi:hypothetical protein
MYSLESIISFTCFSPAYKITILQGSSWVLVTPKIHSLVFADDLIICGQVTVREATAINTTID